MSSLKIYPHAQILRLIQARNKLGISRSTFYRQVHNGLLPPPIDLSTRSVGWLNHELDAVIAARIAGYTAAEVKEMVEQMVEERRNYKEVSHK